MTTSSSQPASIYFGTGRVLMLAPLLDSQRQELAVIKAILAMENAFSVRITDGKWRRSHAVLIDAGIQHELKDFEGQYATLTIVPERRRGAKLQQSLCQKSSIRFLDEFDLSPYLERFRLCARKGFNCKDAFQISVDVIDYLIGEPEIKPERPLDQRILEIVDIIQESLTEPISAKHLARRIFLSEDRFLHLFKEQMGLPLRAFILYQRVLFATQELLSGKSLTESAHLAGFSDSPHFSKAFSQMNGVTPSQFAKRCRNFSVFFCTRLSWL